MKNSLVAWTALSLLTLAASGLTISSNASADGRPAITLSSDAFPGKTYALDITQNAQGVIEKMTYQKDNGSTTISVKDLESGPQLLCETNGHKVVYLSADSDFNAIKGGHIEVRFVTNVMSGAYKNFRILVDVQGSDIVLRSDPDPSYDHSDKNSYSGVFNSLYFKKGWFGISKIVPSEN